MAGSIVPATTASSKGKVKEGKKIRIVIADDHPIFRDGLKKLLSLEADLQVVGEAQNGEQAIELVEKLQPDILLLDLKMPGINGVVALEQLQNKLKGTRVIVLTATEEEQEIVQVMRLGTAGVVRKQTATEMLIKSIRSVASGEIWLDSRMTAAVMKTFSEPLAPQAPTPKSLLSGREREIVVLVAQGYRNKEIAEKMFISEQTVKNHLHNIFDKLGVSDRLELALYAIHKKINEPDQ